VTNQLIEGLGLPWDRANCENLADWFCLILIYIGITVLVFAIIRTIAIETEIYLFVHFILSVESVFEVD
jgi:hypothetical protein